jgi:hypothetical protein
MFSQEQNSILLLDEIAFANASLDILIKVLNHAMDRTLPSVIHIFSF